MTETEVVIRGVIEQEEEPAPDLAIKICPMDRPGRCVLCGRELELVEGPQLYLAETQAPVCQVCGDASAPALMAMLRYWWMAGGR